MGIVARDLDSAAVLRSRTSLPVLVAPSFPELTDLYADLDPSRALLQQLHAQLPVAAVTRALHVHINHGESDKQSMASNNAKAYDRVFVAGEAAVQRHPAGLLEFDTGRLVRTGRPQLDLRPAPVLRPRRGRRTAPCSTPPRGRATRSTTTTRQSTRSAPGRARHPGRPGRPPRLQAASQGGHQPDRVGARGPPRRSWCSSPTPRREPEVTRRSQPVTSSRSCPTATRWSPTSSVGLDWLYLCTEKPMFVTDRHLDGERLRQEVPVSRCADVIGRRRRRGRAPERTDRRPTGARRAPPRPRGHAPPLLRRPPRRRQHAALEGRGRRACGATGPLGQQSGDETAAIIA